MSSTSPREGCALVLPWNLSLTGGINERVKALLMRFCDSRHFSPVLLVASDDRAPQEWDARQPFPTSYQPLYSPIGSPPLKAILSFLYRLPSRLLHLRRFLRQHRVRILNPHYPSLGMLHLTILKALGGFDGPVVYSFDLGDTHAVVASKGIERRLWRWMLRSADWIVTVSKELEHLMLGVVPECRSRISIVPNGVDYALCSSRPSDRDRFPAHFENRPVIISLGNFEERKGHQVLLPAMAQVRTSFPDAGLVVLGASRPYIRHLEQLRAELGLEDCAFFFENISHEKIPAYLCRARLFALATESEGFSLAILEAGAAGLPIVSTRAPGVVDAIKDGFTGRLVKVGDASALAEAITGLLENPTEAARLANNFREEILASLTWDHQFEKYQELFLSLR